METYLTYLTIFVGLTTLALVAQAVILVATYLRLAKLDEETRALRQKLSEQAGPILRNVDELTLTARDKTRLILEDISALSYDARRQMEKLDRLTDELADRLRLQIIRTDELLSKALQNLEEAGTAVKESVIGPVREAAAVVQGVKAAIDFLTARRERSRRRPERVDEELFI
ncbi:MAG TPA: DUF948 domain-containing protein [Candidatus Acidoferrales bacterium]|nr:DUF948 domain-containing protein [Candidatus Acidoferrales bacterium]